MGGEHGEQDEGPVHTVHLDSFYISETEVSIWQYLQCVQAGYCRLPDWWNRHYFDASLDNLTGNEMFSLPVTGVSYQDALDYCKWLGNGYRLPTEAEWEYAARGGRSSKYFWSDLYQEGSKYANTGRQLMPVKSKLPNPYGLYDMLGNVWEWCLDEYNSNYYSVSDTLNPVCLFNPKSIKRVTRGGNHQEFSWNLRCANRCFGLADKGYQGLGFRLVYDPDNEIRLDKYYLKSN